MVLAMMGCFCWIKHHLAKPALPPDYPDANASLAMKVGASVGSSGAASEVNSPESEHGGAMPYPETIPMVSLPREGLRDDARLKQIEAGVDVGEIPDALEYLSTKGYAGGAGDLVVSLVRQWAESDVEQALTWVEQNMPAGEARRQAVKDVAMLWAGTNIEGTLAWIDSLPDGDERDGAVISAAYEIARKKPVLAMELAMELPVTRNGDDLIKHIALQWASSDPQTAAQWAEGLPDEPMKARVQANIATAWGEKDPIKAAQYAVLSMSPGRAQDDAVVAIVQRWVQIDPQSAADWVSAFPAGTLSETVVENILKLWPGGESNDSIKKR